CLILAWTRAALASSAAAISLAVGPVWASSLAGSGLVSSLASMVSWEGIIGSWVGASGGAVGKRSCLDRFDMGISARGRRGGAWQRSAPAALPYRDGRGPAPLWPHRPQCSSRLARLWP